MHIHFLNENHSRNSWLSVLNLGEHTKKPENTMSSRSCRGHLGRAHGKYRQARHASGSWPWFSLWSPSEMLRHSQSHRHCSAHRGPIHMNTDAKVHTIPRRDPGRGAATLLPSISFLNFKNWHQSTHITAVNIENVHTILNSRTQLQIITTILFFFTFSFNFYSIHVINLNSQKLSLLWTFHWWNFITIFCAMIKPRSVLKLL